MKYDHRSIANGKNIGLKIKRLNQKKLWKTEVLCSRYVSLSFGIRAACRPCRRAIRPPISLPAISGKKGSMSCIRWDGIALAFPQNSMPSAPAPIQLMTTQANIETYRRQLNRLALAMIGIGKLPRAIPPITNGRSGSSPSSLKKGWPMKRNAMSTTVPLSALFWPMKKWKMAIERRGPSRRKTPAEAVDLENHSLCRSACSQILILLDWPESLKKLQSIGSAEAKGRYVHFYVEECSHEPIHVFTTRPDTLFGATYLVLAPEHPLVDEITTAVRKKSVEAYRKKPQQKATWTHRSGQRKNRRLDRSLCAESCQRQRSPDLDRRLCADGLWHRGCHGCSRS